MNPKLLKKSQLILLAIVFIFSVVVTVLLVQRQQDPRNRADTLAQTAISTCSAEGEVYINLSFANDSTSSVNISARDLESGGAVNLGSIDPNTTSTGVIATGKNSVNQNIVVFENSLGETTTATYNAIDCSSSVRTCAVNDAKCSWDALDNTTGYKVKITESDTGDVISDVRVDHPTTSFVFPAQPGISYTCEVTPINSCGEGEKTVSEGSCPVPTIPIIPSATLTPNPSSTITPSVTPSSTPNPSSTITPSVTPSSTPVPTNTSIITNPPADSPAPTNTAIQDTSTPTKIKELPPTGFTQDVMFISVIGSSIILLGAFVLIFLW